MTAELVAAQELLAAARNTAETLLAQSMPRRWAHTQGVAAAAAGLTAMFTTAQGATVVAGCWLHDVGYAPDLATTGFHPLDGATYLREQGFPVTVVSLVAFHTGARYEADRRGLAEALTQFPDPDPILLDAVTCADMTTSPDGDPITAAARLADIFSRYSPGTPVSDAVRASAPELLAAVTRCQSSTLAGMDANSVPRKLTMMEIKEPAAAEVVEPPVTPPWASPAGTRR